MRKNKFTKGRQIISLNDLLFILENGLWVYWNDSPKHPSILWHMQLGTLKDAIKAGILYVALEELP